MVESGSKIARSRGLLRKVPAGKNRLLDTACFSIETSSPPLFTEVQRAKAWYNTTFGTLVFFEGCPLSELFGHKRIGVHKTYTATPQFFEEYDPRGIGE